jgi:hypothetical protein
MKIRFYTLIILFVFAVASMSAFSNETLHYVISYKWGLVHKDTGDATLTLKNNGDYANIMLTARTKSWADKVFTVRDTLMSKVKTVGFKPVSYTKISHEGSTNAKDVITYTHSSNKVSATCNRYKEKKGKVTKSTKNMSATGEVYDMLSIFYYLRTVDYGALSSGETLSTTLFSGSKVEIVKIKNLGIETITLRDKSKRETYHIRFSFTTEGKKKSGADMDTWITTDQSHIPVMLTADLSIGKVKCYYVAK